MEQSEPQAGTPDAELEVVEIVFGAPRSPEADVELEHAMEAIREAERLARSNLDTFIS